jgi:hypothetical protein
MSQLTASPKVADHHQQLEKLCVSIRGKLQFMDYLIRAAVADVDRYHDEVDAGTRIFIRQLIEMHASNLSAESESMGAVHEFCAALDSALNAPAASLQDGDPA